MPRYDKDADINDMVDSTVQRHARGESINATGGAYSDVAGYRGVGGTAGTLGAYDYNKYMGPVGPGRQVGPATNRNNFTPPSGPVFADPVNTNDSRERQMRLLEYLHGVAGGQTKTNAQMMFEQQAQQAQQAALGMASSLRDVGPGGQQRLGRQAQEQIGLQAGGQGALIKAQQQRAAEQLIAQLYGDVRAGDMSQADIDAAIASGKSKLADSELMGKIEREYGLDVNDTNRDIRKVYGTLGPSMLDINNQAASNTVIGGLASFFDAAGEIDWDSFGGGKTAQGLRKQYGLQNTPATSGDYL